MTRNCLAIAWCVMLARPDWAAPNQLVPLTDQVDPAILPSGISNQPIALSGQLAYLFNEPDGTSVMHVLGDFVLAFGDPANRELRAREAVVWINERSFENRPYRSLEVFLWQDAEIREPAGTLTSGPALLVTLGTYADVTTNVDDFALQPSADALAYRQGGALRSARSGRSPTVGEENVAIGVLDVTGEPDAAKKRGPKPTMYFQSEGTVTAGKIADRETATVIGRSYLSRGVSGSDDFVEVQADNVVLFFAEGGLPLGGDLSRAIDGRAAAESESKDQAAAARTGQKAKRSSGNQQLMSGAFGDVNVEAVYLEGDVIMSQGPNSIRASRLYYEPAVDRALILDAVVHTTVVQRGVPLYLRAAEIRQLSSTQYAAENAKLSTSEFHTPHYHIGAERVELTNLTPADVGGRAAGIRAGSFRVRNATFNVDGVPIAYWPAFRGNVDAGESAVRSIRTGFSDDFGLELETKWHTFTLLDLETPPGVDSSLTLDYFSERGPAIGVDADYERDKYFGLIRSYLITDDGEDFLGRDREDASAHDVRGRGLIRHRQYLEDDWQVSLELSYISDRSFLEEFFEIEFDNEKEQESLLYLKKQRDNWAFTSLLQWRPLDFTTQTERLPDFGYFRIGEALGRGASWYSENRLGFVRYRPGDQTFRELVRDGNRDSSGTTGRIDSRQEVGIPIDLGAVRVHPFGVARGTAWDDSQEGGGLGRAFGIAGIRASSYLWRVFPESRSSVLDVDGVRHIIKHDVTAWVSHSNVDSDELFPFDETVEVIDEIDGVTLGVRQRFQTKRGAGENRRIVDVLTLDIEAGAFNDATGDAVTNGYTSFSRPENSIARNFVNGSMIWRVNDRTAVLQEINYDTSDGSLDIYNLSVAVERTPRFGYLIGYRYIGDADSNLLGFDLNYRMTEKHALAIREQFDMDEGQTLDFTVALIRKHPRWYSALSFELDEAEDDFGVSLSVWPEGLPQAALGSKRFTGLANTTRITNN